MGSRYLNQFQYTLEKDSVTLFGEVSIGSSGAVGTVKGGGISGIVKESTDGQYTISFEDAWSHLLSFNAFTIKATASSVAQIQLLMTPATYQDDTIADKAITIQCLDFTGSAVNPASAEIIKFDVVFRKSSVGPFDN